MPVTKLSFSYGRAARFPAVVAIPLGTPSGLGLRIPHELNPLEPTSFVARAADFLVADVVHGRLAAVGRAGIVKTELEGIPETTLDVVNYGTGLLALEDEHRARLRLIESDGRLDRAIEDPVAAPDGTPDNPDRLVATPSGLAALTFSGFHPVDSTLRIHRDVDGVPIDGRLLSFTNAREDQFRLELAGRWRHAFDFGDDGPTARLAVVIETVVVTNWYIALYLESSTLAAGRSKGANAILVLGLDGRLRYFETVQRSGVVDVNQHRHIAADPAGHLYQLWLGGTTAEIRQVPDSAVGLHT